MIKSPGDQQSLSIVIATFNEAGIVAEFHRQLVSAMEQDFPAFAWEAIFVDDGSTDETFTELERVHALDPRIKAIRFARNFGHHMAMSAGLDHADGDFVVMMDGDLQDRPADIGLLYKKLLEGHDVVYAIRQQKQFGFLKKINSNMFNYLIKLMIREKIVINSTIFRIMKRDVVQNLRRLREGNRYLVGMIGWVGFKHAGQPVMHGKRFSGKSKYNLWRQFELAFNAIVSFTDFPLKIASRLGLFMVLAAACLTAYILILKIIYNTPILGWTSLFVAIMFFSGVQSIILGIMGEYLGRSYLETKRRPLYIIRGMLGLTERVPQ